MLGDEICGLLISQVQNGVITLCFATINSGSAFWRYFRAFAMLEHKNFLVLYKVIYRVKKDFLLHMLPHLNELLVI